MMGANWILQSDELPSGGHNAMSDLEPLLLQDAIDAGQVRLEQSLRRDQRCRMPEAVGLNSTAAMQLMGC